MDSDGRTATEAKMQQFETVSGQLEDSLTTKQAEGEAKKYPSEARDAQGVLGISRKRVAKATGRHRNRAGPKLVSICVSLTSDMPFPLCTIDF